MNRDEAVAAIAAGTGKTADQAEAFLDILGSAFRRRGWIAGEPLADEAIAERLDTFVGPDADWAAKIADAGPVEDETPLLEARAEQLARQRVEAKIRAEVAAELRAVFAVGNSAIPPFLQTGAKPRGRDIAEWAARIAEGGHR